MKLSIFGALLSSIGLVTAAPAMGSADCQTLNIQDLQSHLSSGASVSRNQSSAPRWSSYHEPKPYAIVNVATEKDVQSTVQYCVQHNVAFLAQSGAHGWSRSIDLPPHGVIINMRGLNQIAFNADKTQATIGGGIISSEAIAAAWSNNTQVMTGNCDTVGVLGAALGGGYGNLLGEHGFSIDQFISMNVVMADGSMKTITEKDTDLWWAMRGAGANFGIVTSAVMKAYPTPQAQSNAFTGALFFTEDKLPQVLDGINKLDLASNMNIYMYFITSNSTPAIMVTPFFLGTEDQAKQAFKSIYDIGPVMAQGGITPYNQWNAAAGALNAKGDRKPAYGSSINQLDSGAWTSVWQDYKKLVSDPNYVNSLVICEAYSLKVAQSLEPNGPGTLTSFTGRHVRFNVAAIPWYANNPALDAKAEAFGSKARKMWRATDGLKEPWSYVNFAFGDDNNEIVYNNSTQRLRQLKAKYDPHNVFRYWFDIGH